MLEVLYCAVFYLIYVLILFNGVDDVMLRNSYRLSIRGLARVEALGTNILDQECRKCRKYAIFLLPRTSFLSSRGIGHRTSLFENYF